VVVVVAVVVAVVIVVVVVVVGSTECRAVAVESMAKRSAGSSEHFTLLLRSISLPAREDMDRHVQAAHSLGSEWGWVGGGVGVGGNVQPGRRALSLSHTTHAFQVC